MYEIRSSDTTTVVVGWSLERVSKGGKAKNKKKSRPCKVRVKDDDGRFELPRSTIKISFHITLCVPENVHNNAKYEMLVKCHAKSMDVELSKSNFN